MSKFKFTDSERLKIIGEAKSSGNIKATALKYQITDKTIYNWIRALKTKGDTDDQKLQKENKRLKQLLADAKLENSILKDLVKKTVQVWTHEDQSLMNTSPKDLAKARF